MHQKDRQICNTQISPVMFLSAMQNGKNILLSIRHKFIIRLAKLKFQIEKLNDIFPTWELNLEPYN